MRLKPSVKIISVALTLFLASCLWVALTPCPKFEDTVNIPDFLEQIWPPPQTEMHLGCYIRKSLFGNRLEAGISVVINTDGIFKLELSQPSNKDTAPFLDRISLYVDGEKVSIDRYGEGGGAWSAMVADDYVEQDLAGWYFLGSNKLLFFGDHTAKVIIATSSGKILEHDWHFKIR
jgi:hypothetical protein